MRIIYFFTFDYSLKTLKDSGSLDREVKYFEHLNINYGYTFLLVTYGSKGDYTILNNYDFIEVLPLYSLFSRSKSKLIRYFLSFYYPFKIKKLAGDFQIIKQNQLLGSWVSIIFKFITRKKLFVRTGYDMYWFSKMDNKPTYITFLYFLLTKVTLYFSDIYSATSIEDIKILARIDKKKDVELIPNWVEDLNHTPYGLRHTNKILCVGRLEYQKNYEHLFKAIAGTKIEVDIYGDGSLRNELEKLSNTLGINVNFKGTLEYEALKNIYQSYKIFVSSSLFEGNPKSTLEAMSAGCVPVVSSIPNNIEIIRNNTEGVLFSFQEDLGDLIVNLFQQKNKLQELSNDSYRKVIQKNSIVAVAELENAVIKKL